MYLEAERFLISCTGVSSKISTTQSCANWHYQHGVGCLYLFQREQLLYSRLLLCLLRGEKRGLFPFSCISRRVWWRSILKNVEISQSKNYYIFQWTTFFLLIIIAPLASLNEEAINQSPLILAMIIMFLIPVGVGYFSLLVSIWKWLGFRVLLVAFLLVFPVVFVWVIAMGPYLYLGYETYLWHSERSPDRA